MERLEYSAAWPPDWWRSQPAGAGPMELIAPARLDALLSGLDRAWQLRLPAAVGDYALVGLSQAEIELAGDAGHAVAMGMRSGRLLITGQVGDACGAYATGGSLAVYGTAGDRCGLANSGADILVRGHSGAQAGFGMRGGSLVLGNGTGPELGEGMVGGQLFVRGPIDSVSDSVRQIRMRDPHKLRLSLLLAGARLKADLDQFALYQTRRGSA